MIIYPPPAQPAAGALLAANNLSEIASAAAARRNLDVRSVTESFAGDVTRTVAPYVLSDGATSNRAGVAPLTAATDPKTRTIQLCGLVPVPTSNPSVNTIIFGYRSSATASTYLVPMALECVLEAGGRLTITQIGNSAPSDYRQLASTTFLTTYSGRTVPLSITIFGDSTTNPVISAGGVDISSSFTLSTAGTVPNWLPSTLAATYYVTGYHWPGIRGPVMEYGFGAWSAAEVATWAQTGVVPSWWAAATGNVSVPRYASNFAAGSDGWNSGDGSPIITGGVDGIGGVDDVLRVTATSTRANTLNNGFANFLFRGRAYRVQWDQYWSGNSSAVGFALTGVNTGTLYDMSGAALGVQASPAGTWQTKTADLVVPEWFSAFFQFRFELRTAGNSATITTGDIGYLKNIKFFEFGPAARWALQPACSVAPDSTANGLPLLLTPGMSVVGDLPAQIVVPGTPMTVDGYVIADQVLTDPRYELVAAYARQTGTATSTITVRETSSGGSTVATGVLSSSATRVGLTVSNALAGGKKLHLTNSSWGGNTVTPFFIFRRSQMP